MEFEAPRSERRSRATDNGSRDLCMDQMETMSTVRTQRHKHMRAKTTGQLHSTLGRIMFSSAVEKISGWVVLINFVIMLLESHARAMHDEKTLRKIAVANSGFLLYYTIECSLRLSVLRTKFFYGVWNILDITIVATGLMSEVMDRVFNQASGQDRLAILKGLRMLRMLRLFRLLLAFKELYMMVVGLARCMKVLVWSAGLIFLVLSAWSMLSVEYLHELTVRLYQQDEHVFGTCSWCPHAFQGVWHANLTWFQIITGDGWSQLGRPLIEKYPSTYILFAGNVFFVMWGLLNLITAAIVDSSITAREDDIASAARMTLDAQQSARDQFERICADMNVAENGTISVDEFKVFLETSSELQQHFTLMGIDEKDLDVLLMLLDEDSNGYLDRHELMGYFTAMRNVVVKTELFYVLRYVEKTHRIALHLASVMSQLSTCATMPCAPPPELAAKTTQESNLTNCSRPKHVQIHASRNEESAGEASDLGPTGLSKSSTKGHSMQGKTDHLASELEHRSICASHSMPVDVDNAIEWNFGLRSGDKAEFNALPNQAGTQLTFSLHSFTSRTTVPPQSTSASLFWKAQEGTVPSSSS